MVHHQKTLDVLIKSSEGEQLVYELRLSDSVDLYIWENKSSDDRNELERRQ